ncbi:AAA family ATPase [Stutzerimonas stutzeri]|uniref:SPOR domain-containing protein n=1 Tax=Stutzerimonas sp. S1 TaxID=3030652 RepID=UPI0022248EC9|nr:AAA family ATPase [Stutzerimonas sp. S1]MCW3149542.1 AAA family ATPase [Stutzerimonas sp. S1]
MTSLSADDSFLNHYGFSHDPFAARVPGFKFFPAQRKPVLGQLHHLARYSQLLLVVTGPEGSGKTLLRQALVASSNKQSVQSVVITPQGTVDAAAVLQQVAQALNVVASDFDAIMAQIVQLALTGQEVYLLVDDAERLTGAAIETLLRFAAGNPEARPHVFLFGDPTLVGRLEALSDGSGEERYHVIALRPYEEDETREYLGQRLEGAGGGLECLNEEQVGRIHDLSGGWPGAINAFAREELLAAMQAAGTRRRTGSLFLPLPTRHLLAVAAIIAAVGLAVLFRGGDQEPATPTSSSLPLGGDIAGAPVTTRETGAAIEFDGADRPSSLPLAGDAQPVIREPLAAAAGGEEDDSGGQALPPVSPVAAAEEEPVAVESVPPPRPLATLAPEVTRAPEPVAPVEQVRKPVASPAPTPAIAPKATTASGWYASQSASNYLVQILGTRSEKSAQAVVAKYGADYRYFVKQHQGKPLYVVTYGNFTNRSAAVAATKELPPALQSGKPWVRSLGTIQQEMR